MTLPCNLDIAANCPYVKVQVWAGEVQGGLKGGQAWEGGKPAGKAPGSWSSPDLQAPSEGSMGQVPGA